jgi:hypothetical protein
MTNTAPKRYRVGVIERAIAYYKIEAEDARTAAENWQDGDFSDRDDEALDTEGPCSVREQQPDGSWRNVPESLWRSSPPETEDGRLGQLGCDLLALPTRFDAYEIAPCKRFREEGEGDRFYYEPCKPEGADVWTLYGHIPGSGIEAIGDFASCELAEEVYARITGERYGQ